MTYNNTKWTFATTQVDDVVTVVSKNGILDEFNNGARLRNISRSQAYALRLTQTTGTPVELSTAFGDVAPKLLTLNIVHNSGTILITLPGKSGASESTVGDFINRINTAMHAHSIYCTLETLNHRPESEPIVGIVFYSDVVLITSVSIYSPTELTHALSTGTYIAPIPAALTTSTTPTIGSNDDGSWTVNLPFPVSYNGTAYTTVYVCTNSYLTFDGPSTSSSVSASSPLQNKIFLGASDRSAQRIYYGAEGTAPNRTFRIIFEGHTTWSGGVLGSPTLSWEVTFHEANNSSFDIQIGATDGTGLYGTYGTTTLLTSMPSVAAAKYTMSVAPLELTQNYTINNITINKELLPARAGWEILGELESTLTANKRGSTNGLLGDINDVIPSYDIGAKGSSPIKYTVTQPAWPRSGDPIVPRLDLNEILNAKTLLGYELLSSHITLPNAYHLPGPVLHMIKTSPLPSIIDFNDPNFAPNFYEPNYGLHFVGFLTSTGQSQPAYNAISSHISQYVLAHQDQQVAIPILYASSTRIYHNPASTYGTLQGIPMKAGDTITWVRSNGSIVPLQTINFSGVPGYDPLLGVLNATGLSANASLYLTIGEYSTTNWLLSNVVTVTTSSVTGDSINSRLIIKKGQGTVSSPHEFSSTIQTFDAYDTDLIIFEVVGPGTLYATSQITGGGNAVADAMSMETTAGITSTFGGNQTGTHTHSLVVAAGTRTWVTLRSHKPISSTASATTFNWTAVHFVSSATLVNKTSYRMISPVAFYYLGGSDYDVSTIGGLINALQVLLGPQSNEDRGAHVSWSFGGNIVIQSKSNNIQISVTISGLPTSVQSNIDVMNHNDVLYVHPVPDWFPKPIISINIPLIPNQQ